MSDHRRFCVMENCILVLQDLLEKSLGCIICIGFCIICIEV